MVPRYRWLVSIGKKKADWSVMTGTIGSSFRKMADLIMSAKLLENSICRLRERKLETYLLLGNLENVQVT